MRFGYRMCKHPRLRKAYANQSRSQNAEKVTHIKGRLLDQATILFNCVPFQNENFSLCKNLLPEGANSFLYAQFLMVWKMNLTTLGDLP